MAKRAAKTTPPLVIAFENFAALTADASVTSDVASEVVKDYEGLDFSELQQISGSVTQVHEDSPWLDEIFKGESWKRVIKNIPKQPKKPKDDNAS